MSKLELTEAQQAQLDDRAKRVEAARKYAVDNGFVTVNTRAQKRAERTERERQKQAKKEAKELEAKQKLLRRKAREFRAEQQLKEKLATLTPAQTHIFEKKKQRMAQVQEAKDRILGIKARLEITAAARLRRARQINAAKARKIRDTVELTVDSMPK